MKEHLVDKLITESAGKPLLSYRNMRDSINFDGLRAIFEESNESIDEFYGFDVCNLEEIFNSSDSEDEFLGFEATPTLESLFNSDSDDEDFLGF